MLNKKELDECIEKYQNELSTKFNLVIKLEPFVGKVYKPISVEDIIKIVEDTTKISIKKIKSKKRYPQIIDAKQLIMFFSKKYTNLSYKKISKEVNLNDHSSAVHGIKEMKNKIDTKDKLVYPFALEIEKKLLELNLKL